MLSAPKQQQLCGVVWGKHRTLLDLWLQPMNEGSLFNAPPTGSIAARESECEMPKRARLLRCQSATAHGAVSGDTSGLTIFLCCSVASAGALL